MSICKNDVAHHVNHFEFLLSKDAFVYLFCMISPVVVKKISKISQRFLSVFCYHVFIGNGVPLRFKKHEQDSISSKFLPVFLLSSALLSVSFGFWICFSSSSAKNVQTDIAQYWLKTKSKYISNFTNDPRFYGKRVSNVEYSSSIHISPVLVSIIFFEKQSLYFNIFNSSL